ncbi:hypothetical protein [Psychromicrobium sp. YIM B11713]|uniref:hypothetical protein n=1 Tax=Psychromicrobium sp. YIM B11713 TaxID=3145233 RepID=UPI00374FCB4E
MKESRASWLASVFGLIALYVLGIVTPLDVMDKALGGINVTNLLQSVFALLAFFFFNDSVRNLAQIKVVKWTYYAPLFGIPIMVICFACIQDKGPSAAGFIVPRMDQLATVLYSGIYMLALLFTDLRIIYMLRSRTRGVYTTFLLGLTVVAAACLCHITYVILYHFTPLAEIGLAIGAWFDNLFYVGLSVTALGWLILFLSKRLPQVQYWMVDALFLTVLRLRAGSDQPRWRPIGELLNDTLESSIYMSLISLRNYERANNSPFSPSIEERILRIEQKFSLAA